MKKILLLLFIVAFVGESRAQVQNYSVGDVVNDFTVTDVHGVEHNLYSYIADGKYVYLDFFFSTCGPCQSTAPIYNEFYDKYGCNGGDIICITINGIGESNAEVEAFEESYGGSFHHAPGVGSEGGSVAVNSDFNPYAYPTYCLIGPENKILNTDIWAGFSVSVLENSLPSSFTPTPMECTTSTEESDILSESVVIYPNPISSTSSVSILIEVYKKEIIKVGVVDIYGREYISPKQEELLEGINDIQLGTLGLSSGVYFVKIEREGRNELISFEVLK